ncbi:hypothetical protein HMPREF0183_1535 [Brevibacterium mcbrellneri ATCC 49030]|uniref:Uncharacterized protein n=1 Tax=Brevibacterium mcbrellneri ATCC 49030 TaxID=585530 RepID=D4YNM5_9MICO|nr:hypothetical protein [Brevibacterium mcbrellneri]EFG47271.1 hypothetical protein HMPREF0183_1535 [Brevibacterium mcbrellneri ATCC 49030]
MSTHAEDLHDEIRRLQIRISSFTTAQLNAPDANNVSRRERIRMSLQELADVRATGVVPQLSDRVLADQVVVLLMDCQPEYGASDDQTRQALSIAQDLRRRL